MESARAFAQKMSPGYYVRCLENGEIRTLWVMRRWGEGKVNGYVKKTHPDEYSAVEWLVKHGARLKKDAPPEAVAEAEAIREKYKEVAKSEAESALKLAEQTFTAEQGTQDPPELRKDKCYQFALLEEAEQEESPEAYEPVGAPPADEAPAESPPVPVDAPEATSPTLPTEPLVPCEPALALGK
jgi:hypothetical protein